MIGISVLTSAVLLLASPEDEVVVEAALNAYVSNRDAFAFGEGKGTIRKGNFPSLESATTSELPSDKNDVELFWAFRGKTCRLDQVHQPEEIPKGDRGDPNATGVIGGVSIRALTDGVKNIQVLLSGGVGGPEQAEIREEPLDAKRLFMAPPLGLGLPRVPNVSLHDYAFVLQAATTGQNGITASYEGGATLNKVDVAVFLVRRGGEPFWRIWCDLERGGIPLQIDEFFDNGQNVFMRVINADLREVGRARWLPFRVRLVLGPGRAPAQYQARELRVHEFEAVHPPSQSSLSIPLHVGCPVADHSKGLVFSIREDRFFDFDSLTDSLSGSPSAPLRQGPAFVPKDAQLKGNAPWGGVALCAGLLCVSVGGWLIIRHARRA